MPKIKQILLKYDETDFEQLKIRKEAFGYKAWEDFFLFIAKEYYDEKLVQSQLLEKRKAEASK